MLGIRPSQWPRIETALYNVSCLMGMYATDMSDVFGGCGDLALLHVVVYDIGLIKTPHYIIWFVRPLHSKLGYC